MKRKSCDTCDYWSFVEGNEGFCQRSPPTVFQEYRMPEGWYYGNRFPITYKETWCGEWKIDKGPKK